MGRFRQNVPKKADPGCFVCEGHSTRRRGGRRSRILGVRVYLVGGSANPAMGGIFSILSYSSYGTSVVFRLFVHSLRTPPGPVPSTPPPPLCFVAWSRRMLRNRRGCFCGPRSRVVGRRGSLAVVWLTPLMLLESEHSPLSPAVLPEEWFATAVRVVVSLLFVVVLSPSLSYRGVYSRGTVALKRMVARSTAVERDRPCAYLGRRMVRLCVPRTRSLVYRVFRLLWVGDPSVWLCAPF